MQMEKLVDAITAIERATTVAALANAVRTFAAPLGYDHFALYSASATKEQVIDHLYWIEGDWLGDGATVDVKTYLQRCPVNHHVLETDEPFFWTKHGALGQEVYRIVRRPQGLGLHGLQVPIFGRRGLAGAMSLGGKAIETGPAARLALTMVGRSALHRVRFISRQPVETSDAPQLTSREREVLRWVAAGKRQGDMALILGLSERTIENHLRRIRTRLGAATTAEAVRMAIRQGEIGN